MSEDVAGATFMAAGSSAPELFASIIGGNNCRPYIQLFPKLIKKASNRQISAVLSQMARALTLSRKA